MLELAHTTDPAPMAETDGIHVRFRDWIGERSIPTLGTNAGSPPLPFQRWRRFKEAFAPEIVERALSETPGAVHHIADPFGGSGTTALAAQFLGIKPTTIEVNPFLADLIEAKISTLDFDAATVAFGRVVEHVASGCAPGRPLFPGAPPTFVEPRTGKGATSSPALLPAASSPTEARSSACQTKPVDVSFGSSWRQPPYRLATWSSAARVGGIGKAGVNANATPESSTNSSAPACSRHSMICAALLRGVVSTTPSCAATPEPLRPKSARTTSPSSPHHIPTPSTIPMSTTSSCGPWDTFATATGTSDCATRRCEATSRSCATSTATGLAVQLFTTTMDALRQVRGQLWNRHIPEMIGAYAEDLAVVMGHLRRGLRSRGRAYIVVGDSRYAGVNVPVAKILTEIAEPLGYQLLTIEPSRSMRLSPQQGGRHELGETLVVLEGR